MKQKRILLAGIFSILFLAIIVIIGYLSILPTQDGYDDPLAGKKLKEVNVKRVVDGDTFIYEEDGTDVRVRLIGIDTPESVAPEESGKENTVEGKLVSEYVTSLIKGKKVYLEYDVSSYDKYNRELAYVYLEDGRMLEEILLEMGYARTMTIPPDVKYEKEFVTIQEMAIAEKRGLWKAQ